MMISLDKFFVLELNERGFDVDYNKMVEIYRASRQHPSCVARRKRNEREREEMYNIMMLKESLVSVSDNSITNSDNSITNKDNKDNNKDSIKKRTKKVKD